MSLELTRVDILVSWHLAVPVFCGAAGPENGRGHLVRLWVLDVVPGVLPVLPFDGPDRRESPIMTLFSGRIRSIALALQKVEQHLNFVK